MRGDQFTRQWKILLALLERKSGLSVRAIAEALQVSVRTVYRDLEVLDRAGVPLASEREGRQVRWRLMNPHWRGLGMVFTAPEVEALLRCVDGCPVADALPLRSLARKVVATLNKV